MTSAPPRHAAPRVPPGAARPARPVSRRLAVAAGSVAFAMAAVFSLAPPPPPSALDLFEAYLYAHAQSLTVSSDVASDISREQISASLGSADLAGSTNYDWARLVLAIGGWPTDASSVTVITRWMRQENGPDNWWNRNNPLNNGWGSGGGGGTGTYPNLLVAAQNAAAALHGNPGYGDIVAALKSPGSTSDLEHAIWASPWSTSHYANGSHWSSVPVPEIKAPDGTW